MHVISIISFSAVLKHDNVYQYLCCFNHNYNKSVSQSHLYVKFKSLPDSLRPGFKVGVVFLYVRLAIPTYPSSYHYLRLRHKLAIFNLNLSMFWTSGFLRKIYNKPICLYLYILNFQVEVKSMLIFCHAFEGKIDC